jgi:putative ABC transport system permease protein
MKRVFLNLRIALRSLYSFKLRTSLAVLGVFLGTFSLILVSNLADSLARKGQIELDKLGKNLLAIRSGIVLRPGPSLRLFTDAANLSLDDVRAISAGAPYVTAVSPASFKNFPIRYGGVTLSSILVTGASPNYPEVRNFYPSEGSFVSVEDDQQLARVAVIGKKIAEKLFGSENPLGKTILIWRVPCQVIGVMEEKGVDASNVDQDNQIFVPVNTFLRRFVNKDYVNYVFVQTADSEALIPAKAEIEQILRLRHHIKPGQKDDFTVLNPKDMLALKSQATAMITILGRISATVSFLIGAIGILSIMILIVNERRVEIGIRRAVGSRKRDIILQFLLESSFISFLGGLAGVVLGLLISVVIFTFSQLPFSISLGGLTLAFGASVVVGILAGIYPSQKATTIQPVDVIRS